MLVLTRTNGQQIVIGEQIVVTVLACGDGKVRLGFAAPHEVPVIRGEIQSEFRDGPETSAGRTPPKG